MKPSLVNRVAADLAEGMSIPGVAAREGISPELGQIIVDDLLRRGVLTSATSLCASGLGACSGGTSPTTKVACAGCPLSVRVS